MTRKQELRSAVRRLSPGKGKLQGFDRSAVRRSAGLNSWSCRARAEASPPPRNERGLRARGASAADVGGCARGPRASASTFPSHVFAHNPTRVFLESAPPVLIPSWQMNTGVTG
ncbi:hypothetical protein PUN28_004998 [Cardiocondyla obscurior]|uniref:Uncharacterized protein n=1 Tax=Cardiocondyla obscurior TaxID=286306 RepID=A0AAW2GDK8_9HYME